MLIVVYVLAVVFVLFVAAVVATHDSAGLAEAPADRADSGLPDGVLQPEDLAAVRFGMVLRGYRMAEVDDTLSRVGAELAARDARIRDLEQALVEVVEPQVEAVEARWSPPNTRPAPMVTSPPLITFDKVVVPDPQVVPVPSRIPNVVRPSLQPPERPPVAVPRVEEPEPLDLIDKAPPSLPSGPPVEASAYGGLDDLFPEVLEPEPAADGTPEAIDITGPDVTPSGEARPQA